MSPNCAHHAGPQPRRGSKTSIGPTPTTHAWRLQLVWDFKHVGNFTKVARQHGTSASVVRKWVRTYEGTGDVLDKARSGRPARGLASPPVREVLKACIRDGKTCTAIVSDLKAGMGLSVGTAETMRKFVKANLARRLRPKKKPNLTATAKLKRVHFCRQWVDKSWASVAVSDSKIFWLCPKGVGDKRWVLFEDDPPTVPAYRSCTKVHAYAAVTKWGKTDLFVTAGTTGFKSESKGVTAKVYVKLLEGKLIPAC